MTNIPNIGENVDKSYMKISESLSVDHIHINSHSHPSKSQRGNQGSCCAEMMQILFCCNLCAQCCNTWCTCCLNTENVVNRL